MPMKRVDGIRGLKDLLLAAIRGGMTTVEQMHVLSFPKTRPTENH